MSSSEIVPGKPLRLALLGTRGIPANYGGFETFAQELSTRLVKRGHFVTVYGRSHYVDPKLKDFRGVDIAVLPCIRTKYLETVTHTAISVISATLRRYDVVLVCNAANAFLTWVPRVSGKTVVLNVDGIERKRSKWSPAGKAFYRLGERLATWFPQCVVTDAKAIRSYYQSEYGFPTRFIPYGASTERQDTISTLQELGLEDGRYLLYVSRLEPENNAHLVIEAYKRSQVDEPLVIVGDAPYNQEYKRSLRASAEGANVRMPGAIFGTGYRELLSHCLCYFQATEVGGTHPALIEAMGVGALVLANETPENREVLADTGILLPFAEPDLLAERVRDICQAPERFAEMGRLARDRIRRHYDWDQVVREYEDLFYELVDDGARSD